MPGCIVTAGNAGLEYALVLDIQARDQIQLLKYQTQPIASQRRPAGIGQVGDRRVGEP